MSDILINITVAVSIFKSFLKVYISYSNFSSSRIEVWGKKLNLEYPLYTIIIDL